MQSIEPRFQHILSEEQKNLFAGVAVVEVHPALPMWMWLEDYAAQWLDGTYEDFDANIHSVDWQYKKPISEADRENDKSRLIPIDCWSMLCEVVKDVELQFPENVPKKYADGVLDAMVAWLLGRRFVDGETVSLEGDIANGCWLVPTVD